MSFWSIDNPKIGLASSSASSFVQKRFSGTEVKLDYGQGEVEGIVGRSPGTSRVRMNESAGVFV